MSLDDISAPYVDPAAERILARIPGHRRRALFLDRDGVINVDTGYVHSADRTRWVPGIFELVKSAYLAELVPIVVTNQAGIARGYYSEQDFLAYAEWVHAEFWRADAPLLATYYCPHHPVAGRGDYLLDCCCRKPEPGMLLRAANDYSIDLAASVLVGDKQSDVDAAHAAGVGRAILCVDGDFSTVHFDQLR